jgi:hypothetical protein
VTLVKWKLVLVCLEIVLISRQDRFTVCAKCTIGVDQVEDRFTVCAKCTIGVDQVQDRFTVCAKCTIGQDRFIALGTPDGTPMWCRSSGRSFSVCLEIVLTSTQDGCIVCAEHTIVLEIILEAPDGTPL